LKPVLKLRYHESLSNFAFNSNVRPYNKVPGFLLDVLPFDSTRIWGNGLFFFHIIMSFTIFNTALLRAYATHSVTDQSWAARREWGFMSAAVLAMAYVVTNVFALFEVGRCSLAVSKPELNARLVSAIRVLACN
jgi:hypothetical protein